MKTKTIAVFVILFISSNIFANTYYVVKNGNDTSPESESQPWYPVQKAGFYNFTFNASSYSSGVYYY